jgi:hypothetical protein
VPQDINQDSFTKSTPAGGESPKVEKPSSPQAERTTPDSLKPSRPKGVQGSPGASGTLTSSTHDTQLIILRVPPRCRDQPSPPEHLPQALGLMDSGPLVGHSVVRAHLCHILRRFRDNVHGLQSPYGTIQTLSRLDSTSSTLA